MKLSPQDKFLQDRLGPSKFSAEGFLGTDLRAVGTIVADDERLCEAAGVTGATIAESLARVYDTAEAAPDARVEISPRCIAELFEAKGSIPSPFAGEGMYPKGEVSLTDLSEGTVVRITRLSIHLIRAHGFFQGIGSRYRVDPSLIIRMLELAPEKADT